MIWESSFWKEELFRNASRIRKRQLLKRWTERSSAGLERDVMTGFYSIRELIEAHKISDGIGSHIILLEEVATNDPAWVKSEYNEKKGDYDVQVGPTSTSKSAPTKPIAVVA
jgi:hypothetical protein